MPPEDNAQPVDARDGEGVQVGSGNVQNNTFNGSIYYGNIPTPAPPENPPRRPRRTPPVGKGPSALLAGAVIISLVAYFSVSNQQDGKSPSSSSAADSSSTPTSSPQLPSPQPSRSLQSVSPQPSASPSPTDLLAGAAVGECFMNKGTGQQEYLKPESSCAVGDLKVVWVLHGTTDISGCDSVPDNDMDVPDDIDNQVLCLTFLDASDAYNADVGDCVFGPPDSSQGWSTQPCGIGNFSVVSRNTNTTADESVCGAGTDWYTSFVVNGNPILDVVLCLEMNYPVVGAVPLNTCLLQIGSGSSESFSETSCNDANVRVTGRIGQYDDPAWCGIDSSVWWKPPGYQSLGFTTCLAPM
jgi:eukaryotic-like serine/threonine-protein kinase